MISIIEFLLLRLVGGHRIANVDVRLISNLARATRGGSRNNR